MTPNPRHKRSKRYLDAQQRKSRLGVIARQDKRSREADAMQVVGTITTTGCLGSHTIELLAGDNYSETHVAIRVDGEPRKPRTMRGVHKCISQMIFKTQKKGKCTNGKN